MMQGAPPAIDGQTVQTIATVMASISMAAVWLLGRLRQGRPAATKPAADPSAIVAAVQDASSFLLGELMAARQLLLDERASRAAEREARAKMEQAQVERIRKLEDRVASLEDQLHTRDKLVAMLVEQLRDTGAPVPAQALRQVAITVENSGAGTPDGQVRLWLADHFSLADLGVLASDALGIPADAIAGADPAAYSDALMHYARRRALVDKLLRAARAARPHVPAPWDPAQL